MASEKNQHPQFHTDFIKADVDQASFMGNMALDNMMNTMMALGAEVWAHRRRMLVIERLLEVNGAVTRSDIEGYVPSPEEQESWQADRDAFIERTFGFMARAGDLKLSSPREK